MMIGRHLSRNSFMNKHKRLTDDYGGLFSCPKRCLLPHRPIKVVLRNKSQNYFDL